MTGQTDVSSGQRQPSESGVRLAQSFVPTADFTMTRVALYVQDRGNTNALGGSAPSSRASTKPLNPHVPCERGFPMKVKDLKADAKFDVLDLTVTEKGEARSVNTFRGQSRVADAKGTDEDGESVSLSLWNDEIDQVNVNDRLRITNGWVRQWRGNLQVSAGRFGKIEVVRE